MGDDLDVFDLPLHQSESGNADAGHLSQLREQIQQNQAGNLNTVLESYYTGQHDYHRLREGLGNLGYGNDRIDEIAISAHQELLFRNVNRGQPSDLTPNQLEFISNQHDPTGRGIGLNLNYRHIHTDENGRQYIDDSRVRNVDGTPSKLYLPTPIPFNPLTREQQAETEELQSAEDAIYIEPDALTGETITLTDQQKEEIMYLAQQYLISDPDFRQAQRLQFRNNVQQIQGLPSVDNIQEDLLELFIDIEDEYDYRQENNGVPRGLTGRQYDYLRHQSGTYRGQAILTEPESGILYYYSERGKTPVPTDAEISQLDSDELRYTQFQITPSNEDYNNLNEILTDYMNGDVDDDQTLRNIEALAQYRPDDPLADPYRSVMYSEFFRTYQVAERERNFRELNNGRPSQISELQYEYLLNHSLIDDREDRYRGQPIYVHRDGHLTYRMRNGINMEIPSDEYIEGFIERGLYTRPVEEPERNPQIDDSTIPDYRDARIVSAIGQERYDNLSPEQIEILRGVVNRKGDLITTYDTFGLDNLQVRPQIIFTEQERIDLQPPVIPRDPSQAPGLIPEAPPGFEPPIIPGQQTQPINLRTGEDLPADTPQSNIIRYQQYFNDNQALYYGFREMFRDILPVVSAGAGGYISYLYKASRSKNTIQTIIQEETQLLNILESRIQDRQRDIDFQITQVDFYENEVDFQTDQGYNILDTLNRLRGELAGREDDPDLDVNLEQAVRQAASDLRLSNMRNRELLAEIDRQRRTIERLRLDIADTEVYTTQIQNDIIELQTTNYDLLTEIQQYSPQILTGISVGYTLGLMLSGYLFPTYMNINEPYITAENIEYDTREDKTSKRNLKVEKDVKDDRDFQIPVREKEYSPLNKSRIVKPYTETFKPLKHGKRPLKYNEIQELKSTLSQSELNKLKNKFLYFDDNKLMMEPTDDKCKNVIQEIQIPKRKIF